MRYQDVRRLHNIYDVEKLSTFEAQLLSPDNFFNYLAERIISDFSPKTVLDVGCGEGTLVGRLRERGVQAWGIDFSAEAIAEAEPNTAPYLDIFTISQPFPQAYDLIICLEFLSYFPIQEASQILHNICLKTKRVLFSSAPLFGEGKDPSSVQPPDFWIGVFSRQGFLHDLGYPSLPFLPWSILLYKSKARLDDLIAGYEHQLWKSIQENHIRRLLSLERYKDLADQRVYWQGVLETTQQRLEEKAAKAVDEVYQKFVQTEEQRLELQRQLEEANNRLKEVEERFSGLTQELAQAHSQAEKLQKELDGIKFQLFETQKLLEETQSQLSKARAQLNEIQNTISWQIMLFLQKLRLRLIPRGSRREKWMHRFFHPRASTEKR